MSDAVWVSNVYSDTTLVKAFRSDVELTDRMAAVDLVKRQKHGEALGEPNFPKKFVARYRDRAMGRQPDFFFAGGFLCVSDRFADVVMKFDLGAGGVYPVHLVQYDGETPVEGRYFGLDIGATKRCVSDAKSRLLVQGSSVAPALPHDHRDDDIAVTQAALDGAEIWIDLCLFQCLFFGDRLVTSMKAHSLAARLKLKRCRVLQS